jgi:hypothetical protein
MIPFLRMVVTGPGEGFASQASLVAPPVRPSARWGVPQLRQQRKGKIWDLVPSPLRCGAGFFFFPPPNSRCGPGQPMGKKRRKKKVVRRGKGRREKRGKMSPVKKGRKEKAGQNGKKKKRAPKEKKASGAGD